MTARPVEFVPRDVAPPAHPETGRRAPTPYHPLRRSGHSWLVVPIVLGLASGAVGCSQTGGASELLDDSAYVDVMAHLASLRWRFSPRDSIAADSARAAILRERQVDLGDLQRFADAHASDTERMAALWELIAERADVLASGLDEDAEDGEENEEPDSVGVERR